MVKVVLTHHCGLQGAEGYIGSVVSVTDEMAQRLFRIKGAVPVVSDEVTTDREAPAGGVETMESAPAEETAEEPAARRRGRPPKKV